MSQTVAYPFHATVKWPANAGPDVMINVYAETDQELVVRLKQGMDVLQMQMAGYLPRQGESAVDRRTPERQPERYERDDDTPNVSCMHGGRAWKTSQYGGFWLPDCGCKLTAQGELKAKGGGQQARAQGGTGKYYRTRAQ